jgi:diguanylate cyclase (GGDEF)-like protein/PAS domain S-box-containing protein
VREPHQERGGESSLDQSWDQSGQGPEGVRPRRGPVLLAYASGPPALVVLVVLEHFHVVASHPLWIWLALFITIPIASIAADRAYQKQRTPFRRQYRLATHSAAVTAVIYLTGWGPVLIAGYAIGALETLSIDGSRVWKSTLGWSLLGIGIGQTLIALHLAPTFLSPLDAQAVALMSTFLLCFVIRMAAAIVAKREGAESSLRGSERSLRQSEERFRSLVQNSTDTTFVVGADGCITYASPAAHGLLGWLPDELVGKQMMTFVHADDAERARTQLNADLEVAPVSRQVEVKMLGRNGETPAVEAVVTDLNNQPAVQGWVVNIRNITDRKKAEDLLVFQARHDGLTGLPNRTSILERAEVMLKHCRKTHHRLAVFFLDIDNFKDVNDTLGHEAGDEALEVVAKRLANRLRKDEVIGRMGGDEFVVLAEVTLSDDAIASVARRLRDAFTEPIRVLGRSGPLVQLSLSVGVAHGVPKNANELLREADLALYQAKSAGRDAWVSFVPEMKSAALRRLQLESELAQALEGQQFRLLFQPIFDLNDGRLTGAEALLRWEHPVRGTVLPEHFIPVLEQTGRIVEVGRWVIEEACRWAERWWSDGHHIGVTVNVSAQQLEDPGFVDDVMRALSPDMHPSALVLEITESGLVQPTDTANRNLVLLKQNGVEVAIDDFGTGYSSLAYLLQFDVGVLKIDRSFVAATGSSAHARAVVIAVLHLGKSLDLHVVAEGIEDFEQLALLRAEGCRWGQGHLFSSAVSASSISDMLARNYSPFAFESWSGERSEVSL